MYRPSRLARRGDRTSSRVVSGGAVDAAASAQDGAGWAGSPCEPEAVCRRTALKARLVNILPAMCTCRQTLWRVSSRTAKPCGPGRHCYGQVLRRCGAPNRVNRIVNSEGEGGQKEVWLPGERGISRKAIAQGRPGVPASPVCCCAVLLARLLVRAADRGCQPAPGLPCALLIEEGVSDKQSSGEMRREDELVCLQ